MMILLALLSAPADACSLNTEFGVKPARIELVGRRGGEAFVDGNGRKLQLGGRDCLPADSALIAVGQDQTVIASVPVWPKDVAEAQALVSAWPRSIQDTIRQKVDYAELSPTRTFALQLYEPRRGSDDRWLLALMSDHSPAPIRAWAMREAADAQCGACRTQILARHAKRGQTGREEGDVIAAAGEFALSGDDSLLLVLSDGLAAADAEVRGRAIHQWGRIGRVRPQVVPWKEMLVVLGDPNRASSRLPVVEALVSAPADVRGQAKRMLGDVVHPALIEMLDGGAE